jgi:phosphoenolpyruvate---glycerone phosphotransferase subunit DhaL
MSEDFFANRDGLRVVQELVAAVQANRQVLSDIDGAIGDGDHGINMAKGFTLAGRELSPASTDLAKGLLLVSRVLLTSIGGAMGPLYGALFRGMGKACAGLERIDAAEFRTMLEGAVASVRTISEAQVGDKTMMDALLPAVAAYVAALDEGRMFADALEAMATAAERGRDSTKGLAAKVGRASRLGERSRGSLDPGATSCALILRTMATSIGSLLAGPP